MTKDDYAFKTMRQKTARLDLKDNYEHTPPKNRLFFKKGDEFCFPLRTHIRYMQEYNIKELDLWLAERETNVCHFFCKHYQEVGYKGNCGKVCKGYEPRNKKSGVCKHFGYTYLPSGKYFFTLKMPARQL